MKYYEIFGCNKVLYKTYYIKQCIKKQLHFILSNIILEVSYDTSRQHHLSSHKTIFIICIFKK